MATNAHEYLGGWRVKWTTELPYKGMSRKSSNFSIGQDSGWFLELSLEFTWRCLCYHLHLRNERDTTFETPMTVTIYYASCTRSDKRFYGGGATVFGSESLVWYFPQFFVSKKISNIDTVGKFTLFFLLKESSDYCAKTISDRTHVCTATGCFSRTFSRDLPSLSRDCGSFVEDETFRDVKLKCGDCTFSAHLSVLTPHSGFFTTMFLSKKWEGETQVVDVQNLDPDVLEQLLKYMYSGEMPDLGQGPTTRRLYEAADKYAVYALKRACWKRMVSDMTQQNCLDLLVLADVHSDWHFKDAVSSFVEDHLHLISRESWSTFENEHPALAVAVLGKTFSKCAV